MASPRTRSGTRKLSDLARLVVAPDGITSTGWPAVRDVCTKKLGIEFDDWQDAAGRLILAKRDDGKLAAMIGGVGMSLPRQVGKTYLIGAIVFALCIIRPGMLVIWSAHHARTHNETFLAMQAFADRLKVRPYIKQVYTGSGDEEIRFRNGSRILFGARERGFGRGIPGVDMIVSDEAQIMSDKALDAQLATMNTSDFGLAIYVGTPPRPDDPSEAFTRMRQEAWSGTLRDAAWIEFGADPGANPNDRKQWAKANPSYPHRTPAESIERLQRKLKPESFLREGLGIWEDMARGSVFGPGKWDACKGPLPTGVELGALGLALSLNAEKASLVGAGATGARLLVKPLQSGPEPYAWVVARTVEVARQHDVPVVVDAKGPAGVFVPQLVSELGPERVRVVTFEQAKDACGLIHQAVSTGSLLHAGYPELDAAVAGAVKRDVGDRWLWGRRQSGTDISPLEAATLAVWGLENVEEPAVSAYEDRGVLTV